jgi:hypothetical protein
MTGRIALLGDSQAQGLSSPLRTLAVSAGWTVPPSDAWVTDAGATTRELIAQLPQIVRASRCATTPVSALESR